MTSYIELLGLIKYMRSSFGTFLSLISIFQSILVFFTFIDFQCKKSWTDLVEFSSDDFDE